MEEAVGGVREVGGDWREFLTDEFWREDGLLAFRTGGSTGEGKGWLFYAKGR